MNNEHDTVTNKDIEALRAEAVAAGDQTMADTCTRALRPTGPRLVARAECERIIRENRRQS